MVTLGYIHNGSVHAPFMRSVLNALSYDAEHQKLIQHISDASSSDICQNRNIIANGFLHKQTQEWLWFLDTDIVFEPDTLYRLLEFADAKERPIVSGMYFSYLSHEIKFPLPLFFARTGDGEFTNVRRFHDQPIRIDGCGMGCCLIHRSVLAAMEDAYKGVDPWVWFGRDVVEIKGQLTRIGEDFTFCHRAAKLGFPIWGHAGIRVDHVKSRVESLGTFLQGNKLYELEEHERKKVSQNEAVPAGLGSHDGHRLSLPEGPDSRQTDEPAQAQQVNGVG